MNDTRLRLLKIFPLFTILFSFWAVYVTLGILIETKQSCVVFALFLLQVYLNWLAVLVGNRNCTAYNTRRANFLEYKLEIITPKGKDYWGSGWNISRDKVIDKKNFHEYDFLSSAEIAIEKVWYCPRCCRNSFQNCHHCSVCQRCIVEQDHHCIFLGTCISNNNIKHFVILLLYLFLSSSYVTLILCKKMNLFSPSMTVLWQHFFPVCFARWLSNEEYNFNLTEKFLLNVTVVLALFSIVFVAYYLYRLAEINIMSNQSHQTDIISSFFEFISNFSLMFCMYGFVNLVFPTILMRYCFPLSSYTHSVKEK